MPQTKALPLLTHVRRLACSFAADDRGRMVGIKCARRSACQASGTERRAPVSAGGITLVKAQGRPAADTYEERM